MLCVRAAPTAVPAMRPATRSTVMAAGNTSVGEHDGTAQGMYEQLGHGSSHHSYLPPSPPSYPPALPPFLWCWRWDSDILSRFSATELYSPTPYAMPSKSHLHISPPLHT